MSRLSQAGRPQSHHTDTAGGFEQASPPRRRPAPRSISPLAVVASQPCPHGVAARETALNSPAAARYEPRGSVAYPFPSFPEVDDGHDQPRHGVASDLRNGARSGRDDASPRQGAGHGPKAGASHATALRGRGTPSGFQQLDRARSACRAGGSRSAGRPDTRRDDGRSRGVETDLQRLQDGPVLRVLPPGGERGDLHIPERPCSVWENAGSNSAWTSTPARRPTDGTNDVRRTRNGPRRPRGPFRFVTGAVRRAGARPSRSRRSR